MPRFPLRLVSLSLLLSLRAEAQTTPNVLWITAEDMSPVLGCYGDTAAHTPNVDRFASEGVRYTHAFATAPVCSPVRSCLINGAYAQSQGTHQMRSNFDIPAVMTGFPTLLREAGYYTSNNVKTDYNSSSLEAITASSWNENSDQASWSGKAGEQPFFSVFNLMTSHQSRSMVWPYEKFQAEVQSRIPPEHVHRPDAVPLPLYYVDTDVVRRTQARFHDCVTAMDAEVGEILARLEADGLADDTIVFFYSDHGSGMPRHKRALLDSGMHVPLIVRCPEKYRQLMPDAPGSTTDRLVSFVDFAPTVLALCEVPVPTYMQGQAFLGPDLSEPRSYVFGHRDRVDEVSDLARSVRDGRFLYLRNYMPHLGYNQRSAWPDIGEIRHEFYAATDESAMTPAQWHFAGPTRPLEELYDCVADPHNIRNLVGDPDFEADHLRLLRALLAHMEEIRDLGFWPESLAWDLQKDGPLMEQAQAGKLEFHRLEKAAAAVGLAAEDELALNLGDEHPAVRYWGAVGFSARPEISDLAREALERALEDGAAAVRIEAANALVLHGRPEQALPVLAKALADEHLTAVLHAARSVELLGERAAALLPEMQAVVTRCDEIRPPDLSPVVVLSGDRDMAMFVAFSARAFLKRQDEAGDPPR